VLPVKSTFREISPKLGGDPTMTSFRT